MFKPILHRTPALIKRSCRAALLKGLLQRRFSIVCTPKSFKISLNVLHFLQAANNRQAILLLEDNISNLSFTKFHELMRQNGRHRFSGMAHRVASATIFVRPAIKLTEQVAMLLTTAAISSTEIFSIAVFTKQPRSFNAPYLPDRSAGRTGMKPISLA
jgi:hypothetical protein